MTGLPRVGIGTDAHAFAPDGDDRPCALAGLIWPGERGIAGHSDGDVAAHALTDAVLAAAGLPDIGAVFGTDRPELAGAPGVVLISHAVGLVRQVGFEIGNASVQVIGNRPRLAGRIDEARRVLSEALGAPVNLSATTTDGLGFTGRNEGVAAIATALVVPVSPT